MASTTEPGPTALASTLDATLIHEARAALDWWATQPTFQPTSSITGGGAIAAAEAALSRLTGGRHVLALPNATYALRVALQSVGVAPGDEVLVSGIDWPAARAAAHSLGATPIPVPVDTRTVTIDPEAAARLRTTRTRAAVATHLHGVIADISQLRAQLGHAIPVIEDCAQAFGARQHGQPVGTLGDLAVFSFGPGKMATAGELGALVAGSRSMWQRAVQASQHPVRQLLAGLEEPLTTGLTGRSAPLAAVLAAYKLSFWPDLERTLRRATDELRETLLRRGQHVIGAQTPGRVAILLRPGEDASSLAITACDVSADGATIRALQSGALADASLPSRTQKRAQALLRRLLTIEIETNVYPRRW